MLRREIQNRGRDQFLLGFVGHGRNLEFALSKRRKLSDLMSVYKDPSVDSVENELYRGRRANRDKYSREG